VVPESAHVVPTCQRGPTWTAGRIGSVVRLRRGDASRTRVGAPYVHRPAAHPALHMGSQPACDEGQPERQCQYPPCALRNTPAAFRLQRRLLSPLISQGVPNVFNHVKCGHGHFACLNCALLASVTAQSHSLRHRSGAERPAHKHRINIAR
jgi:hypothetical protein